MKLAKKTLPTNHPDLSTSHNNIDVVYENMSDHENTRSFYEHTVDIRKRSLLLNIFIFKHIEAISTKCKKILINIFSFEK